MILQLYNMKVLFGGRNWSGDKAIKTFNFDVLAE